MKKTQRVYGRESSQQMNLPKTLLLSDWEIFTVTEYLVSIDSLLVEL